MQRFLIVVEHAYTGAIEEQYGHVLWVCWSHQRMKCQIGVLLRGDAVLYARREQTSLALTVGDVRVSNLYDYLASIEGLLADGGSVYVLGDDLDRFRLDPAELCGGVEVIERSTLAELVASYDTVWYW